MEAKDTVMSDKQIIKLCSVEVGDKDFNIEVFIPNPLVRDIAKAQAEISFKAGRIEGIKEVVEWINKRHELGWIEFRTGESGRWQAFLKGLEGDKK